MATGGGFLIKSPLIEVELQVIVTLVRFVSQRTGEWFEGECTSKVALVRSVGLTGKRLIIKGEGCTDFQVSLSDSRNSTL